MSDTKTTATLPMGLTPRLANIALMAWRAVEGEIRVDCDRLARLAGYDAPATARRQLNKAKQQIMGAGGGGGPGDLAGLGGRSLELALVAWKCVVGDVKVDPARLAALTGFDAAPTAGRQWNKVKKHIAEATVDGITGPDDGAAPGAQRKTPKRTREADGDGDASLPDSPFKRALKRARKEGGTRGQGRHEEEEEDDDDDDEAGEV